MTEHHGDIWRFHYFLAKCECGWISDAYDGRGGKAQAAQALKEHQNAGQSLDQEKPACS